LSEEGNAFARWYYSPEEGGYGPYIEDYEDTLARGLPSVYHVEDTWDNYEAIARIINQRFGEWKRRQR
jgi:hypothetical protein